MKNWEPWVQLKMNENKIVVGKCKLVENSRKKNSIITIIYTCDLTNNCNITSSHVILFLQKLNYFQGLGPFLDIGISTIELINLILSVQDKYIIMIQWGSSKRDLHKQNGEWWFLDLWKSTSKVHWIHEVNLQCLLHSDNSFSSTDIQPCFKYFFLRRFKSRCNTTLQRNDTRFKVWQKFVRFIAL